MMRTSLFLLLAALALTTPAWAGDDPIRYVVAQKDGTGRAVWLDGNGPSACASAVLAASRRGGAVVGQTCEMLLGVKLMVGTVAPGTQVERLESRECREMVQVRVLAGPLKGEVGCLSGAALTSIKPD